MTKSKERILDRIDHKILRQLQNNGRLTNADLARSVNLSPTPCLERVRRLEADGYILDYVALLNPQKLGAGVISFIQVLLDRTNPDVFERFKKQVGLCPEVMECHMVAGLSIVTFWAKPWRACPISNRHIRMLLLRKLRRHTR